MGKLQFRPSWNGKCAAYLWLMDGDQEVGVPCLKEPGHWGDHEHEGPAPGEGLRYKLTWVNDRANAR